MLDIINKFGGVAFVTILIIFTFVLIYVRKQNVNTFLALSNIVDFLWTVALFVFIISMKDSINSALSFLDEKLRLPVALAVGLIVIKILIFAVIRSQSTEFYEDEEKVKEEFGCYRGGWCGSGRCITGTKFIGWCL